MENDQKNTQQNCVSGEVNSYPEQLFDEVAITSYPFSQDSLERLERLREELFKRNNYQYLGDSVEDLRQIREERLRQLMGED